MKKNNKKTVYMGLSAYILHERHIYILKIAKIEELKNKAKAKNDLKKEIFIPKILSSVNLNRLSNNPISLDSSNIKFYT